MRPGSGVISGSGTASDPYHISGWCIEVGVELVASGKRHAVEAISVETTQAHVVIEANEITGPGDLVDDAGDRHARGISITGVSNLTMEENEVRGWRDAVRVSGSSENTFRGNHLHANARDGLRLRAASHGNVIEGNTINDTYYAVRLTDSDQGHVAGNTLRDNGANGIYLHRASTTTVIGNTVESNFNGIMMQQAHDSVVRGNELTHNSNGVTLSVSHENTVDNNTLSSNGFGFLLMRGKGNQIEHNDISDNAWGAWIEGASDRNRFEGNAFSSNWGGLRVEGGEDLRLRENNFVDMTRPAVWQVRSGPQIDARENWWGCPDGPDDPDCAEARGDVLYDPWLTQPNPSAGVQTPSP